MAERKGDWIQTYMGISFWPLDPLPEEILIADIAHALSMNCRWNGHVRQFYSVAEHSVHVSHLVPGEHALQALLHDASEAYISDLSRPMKRCMPEYMPVEANLQRAIYHAFGVAEDIHPEVKHADDRMLTTEAWQLMRCPHKISLLADAVDMELPCLSPIEAEMLFLARFAELTHAAT